MNQMNNLSVVGAPPQKNVHLNAKKYVINVFMYLSFCLVSILPAIMLIHQTSGMYADLGFTFSLEDKIFFVALYAGVLFMLHHLVVKIYALSMAFSIYAVLIPRQPFVQYFSVCYTFKNLALAIFMVVALFVPILIELLDVVNLVLNVAMFFAFFEIFAGKYVDDITKPFAFRLFFRPFFAYLVLDVFIMCLEVV